MGYIDSNLLQDEQVIARTRLHWFIFLKAIAIAILGLALVAVDARVGAAVLVVAAALAIPPWIAHASSEFGVTNRRVIVKVGVLQRRTLELLLRQVEAISVEQSIAGRMLGFGTITLTGTGGVREQFHNIANPLEFRRSIQSVST